MENRANKLWMFFRCRQGRTWGKWFEDDVEEAPWETKTSTCKMSRSRGGGTALNLLAVKFRVFLGDKMIAAFFMCNHPSALYRNLYLIVSTDMQLLFMLICLEGFCNFSDVFWRDKILDFRVRKLPDFYCSTWHHKLIPDKFGAFQCLGYLLCPCCYLNTLSFPNFNFYPIGLCRTTPT